MELKKPMFCEVIFDTNLIVVSEKIITLNPIIKLLILIYCS